MLSLALSLLHILALVLVVRLVLPVRPFFMNPYSAALCTLSDKLLNALRSALPLPTKPLCLLLLALILAGRAALSTKLGIPTLPLSSFAVAKYEVAGFLGWFGVEVLRFVGFYITVLLCNYMLRLWHLGRTLPGYSGDLLNTAGRPLTMRPLLQQTGLLLLLAALYCGTVLSTANAIVYPLAEVSHVQEIFTHAKLQNLFDLNTFSPLLRVTLLAVTMFLEIILALQGMIFFLIVMLIVTMLTGAGPMSLFLMDVKRLICGPIPPLHVGPLDLSLPVLYFVLGFLYVALGSVFLFIAGLFAYVV